MQFALTSYERDFYNLYQTASHWEVSLKHLLH